MQHTAQSIEQEVLDREGVKITISLPLHQQLPHSYSRMFPEALPDHSTLAELCLRVNACLGDVLYAVVNPLGSPARISASTTLESLRAYYAPKTVCQASRRGLREAVRRYFGEDVLQRWRNFARTTRAL